MKGIRLNLSAEDCEEVGINALLSCTTKYKPEMGVKFSTVLYLAIRYAVLDAYRDSIKSFQLKEMPPQHIDFRDEPVFQKRDLARGYSSLPEKERFILSSWIIGKTETEIGNEINLSKGQINKIRHRTLNRLRRIIGDGR